MTCYFNRTVGAMNPQEEEEGESCSNCPPGTDFPYLSSTFKCSQASNLQKLLSFFFPTRRLKVVRSLSGDYTLSLCCFISYTSAKFYICILHAMLGQIYSHFEMWLSSPGMLVVAAVQGQGKKTLGTTPSLHKAGNCRCLFRHSTSNKIKLIM